MFGIIGFRGGVRLPADKVRAISLPIERLPAPPQVLLHFLQHSGVPARPLVEPGQRVRIGQMIGEADGLFSAPVHSPVCGIIRSIGLFPHPAGGRGLAALIDNDGTDETAEPTSPNAPWEEASPEELLQRIALAGVVGPLGKGVPTHALLAGAAAKAADTLIVNAIGAEPCPPADARLAVEKPEEVLTGALVAGRILKAATIVVALSADCPDAIESVSHYLADPRFKGIALAKLRPKHPAGIDQVLAAAITRRKIAGSASPAHGGSAIVNAAVAFAIEQAVRCGVPFSQCLVTVSAPGMNSPKNLFVPIGTPMRHVLEFCAIDAGAVKKLVAGGPLMGVAQPDRDAPVLKTTAGVSVIDTLTEGTRRYACMNCGGCARACPMRLIPSLFAKYVGKNRLDDARCRGIEDCIECGACALVCPARINLVHYIKLGKALLERGSGPAKFAGDA